jgi:hypothetical protein
MPVFGSAVDRAASDESSSPRYADDTPIRRLARVAAVTAAGDWAADLYTFLPNTIRRARTAPARSPCCIRVIARSPRVRTARLTHISRWEQNMNTRVLLSVCVMIRGRVRLIRVRVIRVMCACDSDVDHCVCVRKMLSSVFSVCTSVCLSAARLSRRSRAGLVANCLLASMATGPPRAHHTPPPSVGVSQL